MNKFEKSVAAKSKHALRSLALILSIIAVFTLVGCKKRSERPDIDEYRYYDLEGWWLEVGASASDMIMVHFAYTEAKQNVIVIMDGNLEKSAISSRYSVRVNYIRLKPSYEEDVEILGGIDGYANIRFNFDNEEKTLLTLEYAGKTVQFEKFDKDLSEVPDSAL